MKTKNLFKRTPGSNGNRRTWTWSGWVKRSIHLDFFDESFFMGGTTSTISSGNAVILFKVRHIFFGKRWLS